MLPVDLIDSGELKTAIKSLNDTKALPEKIKVGGKSKEDQVTDFVNAINKMIEEDGAEETAAVLPNDVVNLYNLLVGDEEEKEVQEAGGETEAVKTEEAPKEEAPKKEKKTTKPKEEAPKEEKKRTFPIVPPSVIRPRIIDLIKEGKHTQNEIVDIMIKEFPKKAKSTFVTYINDGKSEKYCKNLTQNEKIKVKVDPETKILSFIEL